MASGITKCIICGTEKAFDHIRPTTRHKNWKCRPCAHKGLDTWNKGLTKNTHQSLMVISKKAKKWHTDPKNKKMLRKIHEENGTWLPLSAKTEWEQYRQLCWYYTRENDLSQLENWEKREHTTNTDGYTLDHKYSVFEGFKNGILPQIIGCIVNLEMITTSENSSKHTSCSITKEELYDRYDKYQQGR